MERLFAPIFFLIIGAVFFTLSIKLPRSSLGNPDELTYFPIMIAVLLIILSIVYLIQELRLMKKAFDAFKLLKERQTLKIILTTILLMFGYTLIFERLGFLVSTLLFLGSLLFLLNGKSKWKLNIITAIVFSAVAWYAFAELLQVSLP